MCAASNVLNESYLNIAYKTNGTLYFNGKKISNLQAFEEGATVQVGLITYVLKNGKFIKKRS
jgi:intracellular septation protein A